MQVECLHAKFHFICPEAKGLGKRGRLPLVLPVKPKRKSSPPQIVGKKQASTAIGTERVEEGRVWRQKDHIERSLNELKGRDGAPFQLHISDNDALDFDTYSKSLFEDPFEFQKSTVPPSPAQLGRSFSTGNDVRSPKREERRVRQFVPSPLASDLRRSNDDLRGKMGTPKSRRGPRSVRSPFPFNASPDVSQRKDRGKGTFMASRRSKGRKIEE